MVRLFFDFDEGARKEYFQKHHSKKGVDMILESLPREQLLLSGMHYLIKSINSTYTIVKLE